MRGLLGTAFFLAFFAFGSWVSTRSWGGAVYVYIGEDRSPAAVRSLNDYTPISRAALTDSVEKQLIASARFVRQEGYVGVELGHPLLKPEAGRREFACDVGGREGLYDHLELTFTGSGVAASGEAPQMVVFAGCNPTEDVGRLETVWLPMDEILASQPKDQDIQINGDQPIFIHLKDIPGEWPDSWSLSSVKLYREADPRDAMEVGIEKLHQARGSAFSFGWATREKASTN